MTLHLQKYSMPGFLKRLVALTLFCGIVSIVQWSLINLVQSRSNSSSMPGFMFHPFAEKIRTLSVVRTEKVSDKPLLIGTRECKIVDMDVIGEDDVRDLIFPLEPFQCSNSSSIDHLFYVSHGILFVNVTMKRALLERLKIESTDFQCCISYIFRDPFEDDDSVVRTTECFTIQDHLALTYSAAKVECTDGAEFYDTTFVYYPSRASSEVLNHSRIQAEDSGKTEDKLSVLILGMDSVSRLMFHRSLCKTAVILKDLEAVEFLGYNRVGENTFPCLVPLLTGKSDKELEEFCQINDNYLDSCGFIWDDFSKNGYITAYVENYNEITTFNCARNGFQRIPVHFYSKPFFQATSELFNDVKCCLRDVSQDELVYQWASNFQMDFVDKLHFGFFWINRFSHDDANNIQFIDSFLSRIIADLATNSLLNNTVLILLSDHGSRIGELRQTTIGEYELNLPVLYFMFPKWYRDKYRLPFQKFVNNAKSKLVTLYDVHTTLLNLLQSAKLGSMSDTKRRGMNLFQDISELRTCKDAGIPKDFCACQLNEFHLDIDTDLVKELAEYVVNYLNSQTEPHRDYCETYSLSHVRRVKALSALDQLKWQFQTEIDFVITAVMLPGNATFEVIATYTEQSNDFVINGGVKRVDKYGDTSGCVDDDPVMKTICFCKNVDYDDIDYEYLMKK